MSSSDDWVKARRLKGFQDYSPALMVVRRRIIDVMRRQSQLASFFEIATPALEFAEVLLGVGGETDKQVFCFQDAGKRQVGLRYDLTVPFARYVAENSGKLPLPFKRFQVGEVWRAEKPQKGRYREFLQGDLDIVGVDTLSADLEVLQCLLATLTELIPGAFTVALNSRQVLSSLIRSLLKVDQSQEAEVLIVLDKLHKIGASKVGDLLTAGIGSAPANADRLLELISAKDHQGLFELLGDDPARQAWSRLQATKTLLDELLSGSKGSAVIDLSVARGLSYYTGVVFETTIDAKPSFGSVCSGGRYDHLTQRFAKTALSGIGGSIGIDRLAALLFEDDGGEETFLAPSQVYVAVADAKAQGYAHQLLKELRVSGISCEASLKEQKLSAQFKQANKRQIPCVVTVGEEELKRQLVNVKDMRSGQELREVGRDKLLGEIRKLLDEDSSNK